jgi:mRNA interferase MazF
MIQRGDIRWFRFSSPAKRRPVVVLGREDTVPFLSQIPVVPVSSQIRGLPWEVLLGADDGMPNTCVMKPEWILSVERSLLGPTISTLRQERWPEVRAALLSFLGLET